MRRTEFSASNAARRIGCAGSANLERHVQVYDPEQTMEGNEIHRLLANPFEPRDHLESYSLNCLEDCEAEANETLAAFELDHPECVVSREIEIPLTAPNGSIVMVNHGDLVCESKDGLAVLVIDYKTGKVPTDPIEDNWQIGTYLASDRFRKCEKFCGKIIQPRLDVDQPLVVYSREDVARVRAQILRAKEAGQDPNAKRTPAASICRYCAGFQLGLCKEAIDAHLLSVAKPENNLPASTLEAKLVAMPMEERIKLLEASILAADMAWTIKDTFRKVMRLNAEFVQGYHLGNAGSNRKITDTRKVIDRLLMNGLTQKAVEDSVELSILAVAKLLGTVNPGKSVAELDRMADVLVDGCVDRIPLAERILKAKAPKQKKPKRQRKPD